jgi:RecA/RadA recombinase
MKNVTVINFYGGPGSGKSTAAAGLFYNMKIAGYNVELTDEFAKECVWEGNIPMLQDQLWVLGHQHRKILRLSDKVDYIITDSPVLLSPIYRGRYGESLYSDIIDKMALECYNLYETNINFMLGRQGDFEQKGRAQDLEESLEIDAAIVNQFETLDIQYIKLQSEDNARAAMRYVQRL